MFLRCVLIDCFAKSGSPVFAHFDTVFWLLPPLDVAGNSLGSCLDVKYVLSVQLCQVCVEPDYLQLQKMNAAKGVTPPSFPVGKY